MFAMITIERLPPNSLAYLLQRGVASIVHSFSMAFLCTADITTAFAAAQTTGDRFQQFVAQATVEKLDTSLLCEAFGFALRGTTYSRVLDDTPKLTPAQERLLFRVHTDHQRYADGLHGLVSQLEAEDTQLTSKAIVAFAEDLSHGVMWSST
jgi:hypothetical protein